jgi:cold shock CspA family protein
MIFPFEVTFRNLRPSPWIDAEVRKRAEKLTTFFGDIQSCRVLVEMPHRHHRAGNPFHVSINLRTPGGEVDVTREANLRGISADLAAQKWAKALEVEGVRKDLHLVIRKAFDSARRRLQDQVRRQRGAVKVHSAQPRGRVIRWSSANGFGAIEAEDGHEVYFHGNSVLGAGAKRLRVGSEVTFVEERGQKGPQASTVKVRARRA